MRRLAVLVGIVAFVLLIAGPALGKGPSRVTIEGPGISDPVVIDGNGEPSSGTELSAFAEATGFWELVFAADRKGTGFELTAEPPTDALGLSFTLTWHLGTSEIVSVAYPMARGGPLVYVEPNTEVVGFNRTTPGGWFAAPAELAVMLDEYRRAADGVLQKATDGAVQKATESRGSKSAAPEDAGPVPPPGKGSHGVPGDPAGLRVGVVGAVTASPQTGGQPAGSDLAPGWGVGVLVLALVAAGGIFWLAPLVRGRHLEPR